MQTLLSYLLENTYGGASVMTVKANDADYPKVHATIRYDVTGYYVSDNKDLGDLFFDVSALDVISLASTHLSRP